METSESSKLKRLLFTLVLILTTQIFAQKISLIQYPSEIGINEKFTIKLSLYSENSDTILLLICPDSELKVGNVFVCDDTIVSAEIRKPDSTFAKVKVSNFGKFIPDIFYYFIDTLEHMSKLREYLLTLTSRSAGNYGIRIIPAKISTNGIIFEPSEFEKNHFSINVENLTESSSGFCAKIERGGFIKFDLKEKINALNGFTLSFWLKTNSFSGRIISIKSKIEPSREVLNIGLKKGGISIYISNSIGRYEIVSSKLVSDGGWHNIVVNANPMRNSLELFVDGSKTDEVFISGIKNFEINDPRFIIEQGIIDEFAFFRKTKSENIWKLSKYFISQTDSDIAVLLKFEKGKNISFGDVLNYEASNVKFLPSTAPLISPGIKISAQLETDKVKISWDVEDPNFVERFIVERKFEGDVFREIFTTFPTSDKKYFYTDFEIPSQGVCFYRVKRVNRDGTVEYSDEAKIGIGLKKDFEVRGNFPNPFNLETKIIYNLFSDTHVKITVYDIVGREIAVLHDGFQTAGEHEIPFNLNSLKNKDEITSGIYLYKIETPKGYEVRKMIIIK